MRVALLALSLVAGCAAQDLSTAAAAEGFTPQCSTTAECPASTVCRAPYGVCVTPEHNGSTVALSVSPPSKLAPALHLGQQTFSAQNTLDVSIRRTVEMTGFVKAGLNLVPATLVAVARDNVIPGVSMRTQTTFKPGVGRGGQPEPFRLLLYAGIAYRLTVTIDDGGATPPHHEDILFDATTGHDVALPDPESYVRFCGGVRVMQGGMPTGIKGVRVTAVQPESDDQCTSAVTNQNGSYELRCPGGGDLSVVHSGSEGGPLLPTFTVNFEEDAFEYQDNAKCYGLPDVLIPAETTETEATVEVVDGSGAPVPGMTVTASTVFEGGVWHDAVLRVEGTTGADGRAVLAVLAGTYRVTVAPHPTDPWAVAVHDEPWDVALSPTKEVTLSSKVMLTTSVVDASGRPVVGAKVVATTSLVDEETKTTIGREYVAETSEDGGFQLAVDPERDYDVEVIPTDESGLPRWWLSQPLKVLAGGAAPAAFKLDPPSLIEGRVFDAQGTPVADTAIDVYTAPASEKSEEGPPRLIGRGVSDAEGRYFLILPCPKLP